ncbi:MAG: type II secretion system protein [Pirellulaceae bacterium]|jgi:prepilin-type N-terminal cleavage/methylation domain-containing protein|nr:type II secretion system protein [Pirellulaceae bacterium]
MTVRGERLVMKNIRNRGFTLVEVLIVVVIMAVLAAVVIPQFSSTTDDARKSTAEFNLSTMRSMIQTYRGQHAGELPVINGSQTLSDVMTGKTKVDGTVDATNGVYGPYLLEFPENSYSASSAVKVITNNPPVVGDVTAGNAGGWLYNVTTGGLWLDRNPGYDW